MQSLSLCVLSRRSKKTSLRSCATGFSSQLQKLNWPKSYKGRCSLRSAHAENSQARKT
jgi:hypothetical protein